MEYNEFKVRLLMELKDFYGKDAEVSVKVRGDEAYSRGNEWVEILLAESKNAVVPLLNVEKIYRIYKKNDGDFNVCLGRVIDAREECERKEGLVQYVKQILSWEIAKDNVYPILINPQKERSNCITREFLDLAVAYTVRREIDSEWIGCCMITEALLRLYGVTAEELHKRAIQNLEQEEYLFYEAVDFLREGENAVGVPALKPGTLYVLSNMTRTHGAAGLLNTKWMQSIVGKISCVVLPISEHEVLFMPDGGNIHQKMLDEMLSEMNGYMDGEDGMLASHSYYYDGAFGELRIHK